MLPKKLSHFSSNFLSKAFLILIPLLIAGCKNSYSEQNERGGPAMIPEVAVITIENQTLELNTELPGRTSAYRIAEIRPQINGKIQKRLFKEGADIEEGEALYQIDPAPYKVAYDSARASLERAEANLPSAKSRAERYKDLIADRAVSQQDYEDALANLRQIEADITYWQSAVEAAKINLDYTTITAPFPGRIGRTQARTGTLVTAYQPVALATLQQLDPIYVDVTQSSSDLLRLTRDLQEGNLSQNMEATRKVRLILENGRNYPLEGRLQFRDVTVDPSTSSYFLRIIVPNPDHMLLPGMFVRAVIQEAATDKAILIPQQGVGHNPKGEAIALLVDENNIVQQKNLVLDRTVGDKWLISSGLEVGDKLIVEGSLKVRPGMKVRSVSFNSEIPATDSKQ